MRIAALWVPGFPLQALRRSAPELAEAPLAIAAGPLPRDPIVAVSAEAAELGVRAGMTAAQARQVAPATLVRTTPAAVAASADEALADVAAGFSPRTRRHRPGEVLLDASGLLPRFDREETVAHELLRRCRRVGLEARVGIASNLGVARVAARWMGPKQGSGIRGQGSEETWSVDRGPWSDTADPADPSSEAHVIARSGAGGATTKQSRCSHRDTYGVSRSASDVTVVRSGEERAFMAPLPLAVLEPAPELATMLARWGLATAGELVRLPRREVALRLGPEGVALHRLASGEEAEAFVPDPIREVLREGVELDDALAALEPFLFVTNGILARLVERLELRGEGFAEVLLELRLEGGERREVRLKLVAPVRDVPAVLALARLQLEAHPPGGPVEGVTALVTPGRVRLAQGSLFGPPLPAPGKLSTTLARLAALVGPERVGAPAVPDTHRPGAWAVTPFRLPGEKTPAEEQRSGGAGEQRRFEGSKEAGKRAKGKGQREDEEEGSEVRGSDVSVAAGRRPAVARQSPVHRTAEGAEGHNNESRALGSCSSAPLPLCSFNDRAQGSGHRAQGTGDGPGNPVRVGGGLRPAPCALRPVLIAFRPPRAAKVDAVDGRPVVVWVEAMGGIVAAWAGPYRFVGEWWDDDPFAREEFDVATTDGSLMRVYFDRLERRWFADGIYD